MKTFQTYRDGLPPTPGIFATAKSVDANGTAVRVGDIVQTGTLNAVVIGVYDQFLFLLDEWADGSTRYCPAVSDCVVIIGHAYDVLAEVARIEAAAAAAHGHRVEAPATVPLNLHKRQHGRRNSTT